MSCLNGTGAGPVPSSVTRRAQNGWSVYIGTVTAGTPARSPAAVVPAPAWWTTAAIRGKTQSCGVSPTALQARAQPGGRDDVTPGAGCDHRDSHGASPRRTSKFANSVATRDELVDLMVDAVAGEYELVPPSDDWLADLVDLARQTRTITRRHPWLVPLVTGQPGIGPNSLDLVEHALALRHVAAQGRHPRLARAISRDPTGITAEQDQFELIVARTMVGILGPATDA